MADASVPTAFGVLIVEDVPVQRMAAASALRDAGLRVAEASTVDGATAALDADPDIRIMVTDIDLVGEPLTGLTLAKAVAARWPEIALLIVSGVVVPEPEALPQGARFLRKPFEAETLLGAVRDLVATRAAGALEPDPRDISGRTSS
ncbi:response regulator [Methylobacterium durans]|uniref:response regulator n=1 Tax=Methylobacterium durans TaxID=2202825 RepID=UPI002AFE6B6A|nr:response regulator [Methylobacterium durans]MEA1832620.1 response regulator [Methylobacterium durans]